MTKGAGVGGTTYDISTRETTEGTELGKRGNMTQGFQRVRSIYTLMGMYMKIGWRPLQIHNIFKIYNNICSNNNNRHKKVYRLLDCKQREWKHNILLKCLDHQNYKCQLVNHNL
jgi:hypothetical protein